jgi:hypothetical protein
MSPEVGDIAAALAYQVKKEIAENYFGGRKALEEEREELIRRGETLQRSWEEEVQPLLLRIYRLLTGGESGRAFLKLINREDLIKPLEEVDRQGPAHQAAGPVRPPLALTPRGRYKRLILTLYDAAVIKADAIHGEFKTLQKRVGLFNEDLGKFNGSFNLAEILSFIKAIENSDDLKGVLGQNTDPRAVPELEKKLLLRPLDLSRSGIASLEPLPPLREIRANLTGQIDGVYQQQGPEIKRILEKGV